MQIFVPLCVFLLLFFFNVPHYSHFSLFLRYYDLTFSRLLNPPRDILKQTPFYRSSIRSSCRMLGCEKESLKPPRTWRKDTATTFPCYRPITEAKLPTAPASDERVMSGPLYGTHRKSLTQLSISETERKRLFEEADKPIRFSGSVLRQNVKVERIYMHFCT